MNRDHGLEGVTHSARKSVIDIGSSLHWRKSSYSVDDGSCVEIAPIAGNVAIRDSKIANGSVIGFEGSRWATFVGSLT